jgi:hypothetical protein
MKSGYKKGKKKKMAKGYAKGLSEPAEYSQMPPTISLSTKDVPELSKWKVGGKYKLTIEVEQTSMSKGDEYDMSREDNSYHGRFKVTDVKVV